MSERGKGGGWRETDNGERREGMERGREREGGREGRENRESERSISMPT